MDRFFSAKQLLSIRESTNKINIWEGAVRSGKTYASLWRWIDECRNGPPGQFAVICRTYDTFKRNIYPELINILGKYVTYSSGKRELLIFDRLCYVIGADDERSEAKIRGPTFAGIYIDELTIIPESVIKMAFSRPSIPNAKIFATTNPDSPLHWVKQELLNGENQDVVSWQFLMEDNPALQDDYKEFLKRQYKGVWYQRFIEGKWVQAEGAIFDFFDQNLNTIVPWMHTAREYIVGIDYGTTNACSFVLVAYNPERYPHLVAIDEYYFDSKKAQYQKTDADYAKDLARFISGKNIRAIYLDPSAASFRMELIRSGIQNLLEAKNDVLDGIRFVSTLLSQGTLKIGRNCLHLIAEIQGYVWDKDTKTGKERPLKKNDHGIDALRYAIFSHFFNKTGDNLTPQDLKRYRSLIDGTESELPSFFQKPTYYL